MNDRNVRRANRATNVQTFGREHADDFPPGTKAAEHFAALDAILDDLVEARVGQLRGPVGKPAVIRQLSADFKAIARASRAIVLDETHFPAAAYRHPRRYTEAPVATHADALLQLLEDRPADTPAHPADTPDQAAAKAALRGKFIAYLLPADFVATLRAHRDALDACNTAKYSARFKGVQSTSAITTLLDRAQALVTRLDASIHNKYADHPGRLAAWRGAAHTTLAPKRKPHPDLPEPPAPPLGD